MENDNPQLHQPGQSVSPTEPAVNPQATPPTISPQPITPSVDNPSSAQLVQKKKRHPILRIVFGVIIVLVIIIGLFVIFALKADSSAKTAEPVGTNFIEDMVNGNDQAAYQLTASNFQQVTSQDTFAALTQAIRKNVTSKPTVQNYTVSSSNVNGKTTTTVAVNYSVSGSSGSGTINLTMQKNNGQWQIVSAHFPDFAVQGYTVK
jgi:hypothetical protein